MITFPSALNLEFGSFFGEVLSVSGSRGNSFLGLSRSCLESPRSQISLPRKFIFSRPKLKYGSWTTATLNSKVVPQVHVTAEEQAAIVVLHKFLMEHGFSSRLVATTITKSDLFIEHLASRLKSGCPVGHEFTASEIRDALIPYLESLLEDYGSNLIKFLENFPIPPAKGFPVGSFSKAKLINSVKLKALSTVIGVGSDEQLPPHILYLLELGVGLEQIKRMICKYSGFAYLSLDGNVRPWTEFLLSLELSHSDISTIFMRMPELCCLSLSEKVIPTMKYLENFGLDKKQLGKVIYRFPNIVALSIQKIEATVDFFHEMGLSREQVGKVFNLFPNIAGLNVENNVRPKAEYFRSLGARVDNIILRCPQVLALNFETNLKVTTEFFLSKGFSKEEIGHMASKCGSIYMYSLPNNLIPKYEFFLTTNYSEEELVKYPQYFKYSLAGRIKPRYRAMEEAGVHFSLTYLLDLPDAKFPEILKRKVMTQRLRDAGHVRTE